MSPPRKAPRTRPIGSSQRARFAPIASAMVAVTRLLMLTPLFSACFVNFEYSVRAAPAPLNEVFLRYRLQFFDAPAQSNSTGQDHRGHNTGTTCRL